MPSGRHSSLTITLTPYAHLLAWLLYHANAKKPLVQREAFYALKDQLCHRYGTFQGHDLQHIIQPCWGEGGGWDYEGRPCEGNGCRKCMGTGIYRERWIRLERWQVGPYLFHKPIDSTSIKPKTTVKIIEGYIIHHTTGQGGNEARLWLYLLAGEWALWWHDLTSHWSCGWYAWPLLLLQRVACPLRHGIRRKQCWCGRWFWSRRGWNVCRPCRKPKPVTASANADEDDIPF